MVLNHKKGNLFPSKIVYLPVHYPPCSSTSEHNKAIKSRIMKEIQKATGSFSREQIVGM